MDNLTSKIRLKKLLIISVAISLLLIYIVLTLYNFVIKDTSKDYSIFQTWRAYYSVNDWNLDHHAIADIDGDGIDDMLSIDNCLYLSTQLDKNIPSDQLCSNKSFSSIVFSQQEKTGQKFDKITPTYLGLRKSFLVKDLGNVWKYYDYLGFQLRKFELKDDNMLHEVTPTLLDRYDHITYQLSHLGVVFILLSFRP